MKVSPLKSKIEGPLVIENPPFTDDRGFFSESFNLEKFKEAGLPTDFTQDNHSHSKEGVLRGLHFQFDPLQAKLVWVASGKIFDVIVDCRPRSPTFLEAANLIIDRPGLMFLIPEGFAHGFCVLDNKPADVMYKMNSQYNPKGESGILWSDSELKIDWPVKDPIISQRDQNLLSVKEFREKFGR